MPCRNYRATQVSSHNVNVTKRHYMKERACKPKATVYNEEAGKLINMTH